MAAADAYVLDWDVSKLGDDDFFCSLVKFPGSENIAGLASPTPHELPERVLFRGNFEMLERLDYPYNDVLWPLMSDAMLAVLTGLGEFPFMKIPVTMLDDTVRNQKLFTASGDPDPEHSMERFAGIQLLSYLDAFDWERAKFERDEYVPELTTDIHKLVLKAVPGGFPPLFTLSASPTMLLVSGEAGRALKKAKIAGIKLIAVADYPPRH